MATISDFEGAILSIDMYFKGLQTLIWGRCLKIKLILL